MAQYTGLSSEVIAHWTREGLLTPSQAVSGSGHHKEFDSIELEKAEILGRLRGFGFGIDGFRWLARTIDAGRALIQETPVLGEIGTYQVAWAMDDCWAFSQGKEVTLSTYDDRGYQQLPALSIDDIIENRFSDAREFTPELSSTLASVVRRKFLDKSARQGGRLIDYLMPKYVLDKRITGIWLIWPTTDGWEFYEDTDNNMSGLRIVPPAGISLYVSRILRELWGIYDEA